MNDDIPNKDEIFQMSKQAQKYHLSLAGEFYVAAELQRRGISAAVTYGNAKNADVVAFSMSEKFKRIKRSFAPPVGGLSQSNRMSSVKASQVGMAFLFKGS